VLKEWKTKAKLPEFGNTKTKCIQCSKKADFETYYLITNYIAEKKIRSLQRNVEGRTSNKSTDETTV
jgi:hypothetical protein